MAGTEKSTRRRQRVLRLKDNRRDVQLNIPPAVPPTAQQASTVAARVRSGTGTVCRFISQEMAKSTAKYRMPVSIPQKNLRDNAALPARKPPKRQAIT